MDHSYKRRRPNAFPLLVFCKQQKSAAHTLLPNCFPSRAFSFAKVLIFFFYNPLSPFFCSLASHLLLAVISEDLHTDRIRARGVVFSEPLLTLLSSPGLRILLWHNRDSTDLPSRFRVPVFAGELRIFFLLFCSLVYFLWESIKFTVYPMYTIYNTFDNALVTRNTISATMKYTVYYPFPYWTVVAASIY